MLKLFEVCIHLFLVYWTSLKFFKLPWSTLNFSEFSFIGRRWKSKKFTHLLWSSLILPEVRRNFPKFFQNLWSSLRLLRIRRNSYEIKQPFSEICLTSMKLIKHIPTPYQKLTQALFRGTLRSFHRNVFELFHRSFFVFPQKLLELSTEFLRAFHRSSRMFLQEHKISSRTWILGPKVSWSLMQRFLDLPTDSHSKYVSILWTCLGNQDSSLSLPKEY